MLFCHKKYSAEDEEHQNPIKKTLLSAKLFNHCADQVYSSFHYCFNQTRACFKTLRFRVDQHKGLQIFANIRQTPNLKVTTIR